MKQCRSLFIYLSGPEKDRELLSNRLETGNVLRPLTTDTASQLDVLWHDGDTLGVDCAQVGILEKSNQVSFTGLLQCHDGGALESQVSLEVLGDFSDETLERQFPDQQFGALLVATDFTESDCSWPVTMGFLDSSRGWCTLPGGLGSQLFSWGFSSRRFPCGLLSSCHLDIFYVRTCTLTMKMYYCMGIPCFYFHQFSHCAVVIGRHAELAVCDWLYLSICMLLCFSAHFR